MSTITTSTYRLHMLLSKAAPYADQTTFSAALNAVRLRTLGEWLTATATDAYQAAIVRVEQGDPAADFDALISVADCRAILRAFPKTKSTSDVDITLTVADGLLVVTRPDVFPQSTLTVKLVTAQPPKAMMKAFREAAARPPEQKSLTAFNGRYMPKISDDITISLADGLHPALFVSADIIVIVMPKRQPEHDADKPLRNEPGAWLDMLTEGEATA